MITKDYIKMCEKAKQIQDLWERKEGSWVKRDNYSEPYVLDWVGIENISVVDDKWWDGMGENFVTWLPTQEQLQEMVKKRHIYYLIKDFQIFQVKHTIGLHITDMNELWLAFVMKEKHNKVWDGEKWK